MDHCGSDSVHTLNPRGVHSSVDATKIEGALGSIPVTLMREPSGECKWDMFYVPYLPTRLMKLDHRKPSLFLWGVLHATLFILPLAFLLSIANPTPFRRISSLASPPSTKSPVPLQYWFSSTVGSYTLTPLLSLAQSLVNLARSLVVRYSKC